MTMSLLIRVALGFIALTIGCSSSAPGEKQPALPQGEDGKPLPDVPSPYDALPAETHGLLKPHSPAISTRW